MRVRVFGLTGGIASGKSTVSALLNKNGIPVVDASEVLGLVQETDLEIRERLLDLLGADSFLGDGKVNQGYIESCILEDSNLRYKYNQIVRPAVVKKSQEQFEYLEKRGCRLICFNADFLVETGRHTGFRPLVVIACKVETQISRIMLRDSLSREDALMRINVQIPLEQNIQASDYVVWNDTTVQELEIIIISTLQQIRRIV